MDRRTLISRIAFVLALIADLFLRPTPEPRRELGADALFQEVFAQAFAAQEAHSEDLFQIPGVVGTAIGLGPLGTPVVKVYIAQELSAQALPANLDGVALVREVTGAFQSHAFLAADEPANPRARFPRPVPIGVSTGQKTVTAGTVGARVTTGSEVFGLSNNHVFAASNDAAIGDNILQPGVADGGADPESAIGTLADFEPIRFCAGAIPVFCPDNRMDAAIAATTTENLGNSTPENGYGTPRSKTAPPNLSVRVQKYGRTTLLTNGIVSGIHASVNVGYRGKTARFTEQIIISGQGFSQGGDSGSLIVTQASGENDRRPVALLFAGSATTTIATPIDVVLERFGVAIDGND